MKRRAVIDRAHRRPLPLGRGADVIHFLPLTAEVIDLCDGLFYSSIKFLNQYVAESNEV
jgi:hypothetical protein